MPQLCWVTGHSSNEVWHHLTKMPFKRLFVISGELRCIECYRRIVVTKEDAMNQWLRSIGLLGIMGLVASPVNGESYFPCGTRCGGGQE